MKAIKIRKQTGRYTLSYIGDLSKREIAKILTQFVTKDSKQLLFEFFSADPYFWDENMIENDKEHFYDLFLNDNLLFHHESTKTNLISRISNILQNYFIGDEAEGDIFNKFVSGELVIPEQISENIKTNIYEAVLTEENPKILNFIREKVIFTNNSWYDVDTDKLKSNPLAKVKWYAVQDVDEIVEAINLTEVFFKCLLHTKNSNLEDYSCAIIYYEAESDFHLEIVEEVQGFFEDEVLPRLNNLFGDISFSLSNYKV